MASNGSSSKYNLYVNDDDDDNDEKNVRIGKSTITTTTISAGGELEEEIEEVNTKSELKVIINPLIYSLICYCYTKLLNTIFLL